MKELDVNNIPKRVIENFLKKFNQVDKDSCWEWEAAKMKSGYGFMGYKMKGKQYSIFAHRLSAAYFIGKVPKGCVVMHKCDNPSCVNPNHLKIGKQKDNMHDKYKKGRDNYGYRRKYNKEDAVKVFSLLASDKSVSDVLRTLNLKTISNFVKGTKKKYGEFREAFDTFSDEEKEIIYSKLGRKKGENTPQAKISETDVHRIRIMNIMGHTCKDISKFFDLHPHHISSIINKKRWAHVTDFDCYRKPICNIYGEAFCCPKKCSGYLY